MRILGPLVILLALYWTWGAIHSPSVVAMDTHEALQSEFVKYVEKTLADKGLQPEKFQVEKIWSEPLDTEHVRIVFSYSFLSQGVSNQMSGQTILKHGDGPQWTIQNIHVDKSEITFEEGIVLNSATDAGNAPAAEESVKAQKLEDSTQTETPAHH